MIKVNLPNAKEIEGENNEAHPSLPSSPSQDLLLPPSESVHPIFIQHCVLR